jgi:cation diffusion facilitator CzcD-associated flavoprotein CzcO
MAFNFAPVFWLYQLLQFVLDKVFSPAPPPPNPKLRRPRIAVIGAGLTGVSAASHCIGHGFDVMIFEADGREHLGGIWAKVNTTSGLQINSIMYRFHPSVRWTGAYPKQNQIVEQITDLWKRYGLESRTKFHVKVDSVQKNEDGKWIINENTSYGDFDGVIAAVGTCGDPKIPHLPEQEKFEGEIHHSSRLDGVEAKGKRVIIIGGGASAVEALEWAVATEAKEVKVLSRSDKWVRWSYRRTVQILTILIKYCRLSLVTPS